MWEPEAGTERPSEMDAVGLAAGRSLMGAPVGVLLLGTRREHLEHLPGCLVHKESISAP